MREGLELRLDLTSQFAHKQTPAADGPTLMLCQGLRARASTPMSLPVRTTTRSWRIAGIGCSSSRLQKCGGGGRAGRKSPWLPACAIRQTHGPLRRSRLPDALDRLSAQKKNQQRLGALRPARPLTVGRAACVLDQNGRSSAPAGETAAAGVPESPFGEPSRSPRSLPASGAARALSNRIWRALSTTTSRRFSC